VINVGTKLNLYHSYEVLMITILKNN